MLTFQEIIQKLQEYWTAQGCILGQSYDIETGAGTFNPETFLRCLGPEPYRFCNVEISKRPTDGRYGKNPNRLQKFHQFQVIIKPSLPEMQELYLGSLAALGLKREEHDFRFVHDDWESPTQGAWGLGWEVWCDGMEITQFTYFQSVGGQEVKPVVAELAYGLERIAMFLQGVKNVYDVKYNDSLTYGQVYLQSEIQSCHYNFEEADIAMWKRHFEDFEKEAKRLIANGLPIPAYDFAIKASHAFNILDARSAISTTARVDLMHRIRDLSKGVAEAYIVERENLGFPLLSPTEKTEHKKPSFAFPRIFPSYKNDDFLLEIGSEELPATFVPAGMIQLEKAIRNLFQDKGIRFESLKVYGTPRRLAIHLTDLPRFTPSETVERKGPSVSVAFDANGDLTAQGMGFFNSLNINGLTKSQIEKGHSKVVSIKGQTHLVAHIEKEGSSVIEILRESLPKLIGALPFPKSMRWEEYDISFARPIRFIVALFGTEIIPFSLAGVHSGNTSYGHSQLAKGPVMIKHPAKYVQTLRDAFVIVCPEERARVMEKMLDDLTKKLDLQVMEREAVLTENLNLSEFPTLALYHFDPGFLSLPQELLSSEMINHQKYFPLANKEGTIQNKFIITVDRKPTETILRNNQAVLIARLSDGLFLYEQDIKRPLESFNNELKNVVFHKQLGSLFDKTLRIQKLCDKLAHELGQDSPTRAASLCKADLATAVVYEFPELQGIMGKYYALLSSENAETAQAIEEHWWPLSEGGSIPTSVQGSILALADKFDNLVSYMNIGIKPSSSKDPYGLRRCAIGIIRILIENRWSLDLSKIASEQDLLDFIILRMKAILLDYGFKGEEIEAVLTKTSFDVFDIYCKAKALHEFRKESDAFDKLHQITKRAKGQIASENKKRFDPSLLQQTEEKQLSSQMDSIEKNLSSSLAKKDYLSAFYALSSLSEPLSKFFDTVHVMSEDLELRNNRIALLQKVFEGASSLVDFSRL